MNQIINGFNKEGLEKLVEEVNHLLSKREYIFTFSGHSERSLAIKGQAKLILKDLFYFLNAETLLNDYKSIGGWHNEFTKLGFFLEYKAKRYFDNFTASLNPFPTE